MAYLENDIQLDQLHLRIKWAFLRAHPPAWHMDWWVPYTVFWLVTEGEREVLIDSEPVKLAPGDLVTFRPNQIVKVMEDKKPFSFYALACDYKVGHIHFVDMYRVPMLIHLAEKEEIARLLDIWKLLIRRTDELAEHFNREKELVSQTHLRAAHQPALMLDSPETMQYLMLQGLLYNMAGRLFGIILPRLPVKPAYFDPRIHAICTYIFGHLDQKITLKQLSEHFYVSSGHLIHLFRKSLNVSPLEYVRLMRMNRARELLLTTALSVKEISEQIGMPHQSEFSRLFRMHEGLSPLQFRKKFNNVL